MKKFIISLACATFLTAVAAAASIASPADREQVASEQHLKCAIWEKKDPHAKPDAPRVCQAYWGNDTAEDERELAESARKVSMAGTAPSAPVSH